MLNVHIYSSYLSGESRILKETRSIVSNTIIDKVIVLGLWKRGLSKTESIGDRVTFVRFDCLVEKSGKLKFLNGLPLIIFFIKSVRFLYNQEVSVINCHSLIVLPLCVFLKVAKGARLIYDPHELETETMESTGVRRWVSRLLEKLLIRYADHCIVVSDSIRNWYRREYNLQHIDTVKNIPSTDQLVNTKAVDLKGRFGVPGNELLFIYQGYLSKSRGVDSIVAAFARENFSRHVLFMGSGPLEELINRTSLRFRNIHHLPPVGFSDLLSFTAGADVGIHIIPNTCLNHYYCLPNKVFEYVLAGIPFIVSDFPDIRKEFERLNVCFLVEPNTGALSERLDAITTDQVSSMKLSCKTIRDRWKWEDQNNVYHRIFSHLIQ